MKKGWTREELVFFSTGIIFMLLIAGIKYLSKTDIGFASLMVTFLFGGVVGLLAMTPKDSFIKNVVFIFTFAWLIWAFLSPVSVVGDNWVVKSTELLAIITIVVIFLEKEFWNSFNRMRNKPARFGIGFVGSIFLAILISKFGLFQAFFSLLNKHWALWVGFVLLWVIFLFFLVTRSLSKLIKKLGKRK
jgi:hypothetical protein